MDLDTPDEVGGSTKRAKLEKVRRDTDGRIVPPELLNEIKATPEQDVILSIFFEMYQPEQCFHLVLDAFCRLWDLKLDGEYISLFFMLWRTAESHRAKTQKERMDKQKKESKGSGKSPKKPRRASRRR